MNCRIEELVNKQRAYFETGATKKPETRLQALIRLKLSIQSHESEILEALKQDLGKSAFESYMAEIGMVLSELSYIRKHLTAWARPRKRPAPLAQFPSSCQVIPEPYGVTLIMAPWNYPFMLCMDPLIGAVAAGNCCILKPANYSAATSAVIRKIVTEVFPEEYVAVVEGGREENAELLNQKFDYIFFTGSRRVGQLVLERAAVHVTPVSLELGGKSPCIVDLSANLKMAAKRIVFGKFLNAGQTCVAPDYLLVHREVKEELLRWIRLYVRRMYGAHPLYNENYPKIITEAHFDRVCGLMEGKDIFLGGQSSREKQKIAPTVLDHAELTDPVMQEEIFGPVLPVLTYKTVDEAIAIQKEVLNGAKPLALYLFARDKTCIRKVLEQISFGGGCINDTIVHLATSHMGFGGVGDSGMGSYHGKLSFDTFTHEKSILKKSNFLDLPVRYQPAQVWKMKALRIFMK